VAAEQRPRLFDLVERTPELDWLLLTKRVATARQWLPQRWLREGFPRNVWMGFSAEDQARYDERVRPALDLGAHVTFCSYEPALGPINFRLDENFLDWVIGGGESSNPASRARPMHPAWMRSARDQCAASGVAFHFKQWGEWRQMQAQPQNTCPASGRSAGGTFKSYPSKVMPDGLVMELVGRKLAGRTLDGRTWDEFPMLRS
jgi:protein gp37